MTYQEVNDMIESIGLPYSYYEFSGPIPAAPYIAFYYQDTDNLYADGLVFQKIETLIIELYADQKDIDLERRVEDLLYDREIAWSKVEEKIDGQGIYMTTYTMEIIVNAE